jgi:hypothetical protein
MRRESGRDLCRPKGERESMKRESVKHFIQTGLVALAVTVGTAGCATITSTVTPAWSPGQTAGTTAAPRVEDCAIVSISSPSKYACNGKVSTSFQLAKLRMDEEKKYAAGN